MEELLKAIEPHLSESAFLGDGRSMVGGMLTYGIDAWNDASPDHTVIAKIHGHRDGFGPIPLRRLL